jgi:hypothetical protein
LVRDKHDQRAFGPLASHGGLDRNSDDHLGGGDASLVNTGGRYCSPPTVPLAVSRKNQGGTNYDLPLPLIGSPAIECRSGGGSNVYQIVVGFPSAVVFDHASITSGSGTVTGASGNGTTTVTIDLSGVVNQQTINVTVFGVNDGSGAHDLVIPMSVLIGDTNASGAVNSSDVSQTKSKSGQPVTSANFRADVTANGAITATDVSLVRSRSGTALP